MVANNNLAYMYAEEETNLDNALQMAQTAKMASPDDGDVNDTLGWVFYKKGMPDQAISALQHAVEVKPSNPLYHYHLGLAYIKAGQAPQARMALERAVSLGGFPEVAAAKKALAGLGSH